MKQFFSLKSLISYTCITQVILTPTTLRTEQIKNEQQNSTVSTHAPVAIAELIDKMTILEIKLERIADTQKLKNICSEYEILLETYKKHIPQSSELEQLKKKLKEKNMCLWDLEDSIRAQENEKNFEKEFVRVARAIYLNNDDRGRIKRNINIITGSHIVEEKSYGEYRSDDQKTRITTNPHKIINKTNKIKTAQNIVIAIEMPIAELLDKITILEIKKKNISDQEKLKNIETELEILYHTLYTKFAPSNELTSLTQKLRTQNEAMWNIQDKIREKEATKNFDNEFIELARGVYYTNDKRCTIKRAVNVLLGSRLIEEKAYTNYSSSAQSN